MTLRLPEEDLRLAIANEDWDRTTELLHAYSLNVQRAVDDPPPDMSPEDWRNLLAQHDAFRNELALSQANVSELLGKVRRQRSVVRTYQRGGL